MKNISKKYTLVSAFAVFALMGVGNFAFSQQQGEVQDQEFIIRKDRVLTLPKQPRKFERIPVLPIPKSSNNFSYEVKPFFLSLAPVEIKPEAAQKQFPKSQEDPFAGFLRLGYGNYNSPLVEGRYNYWEDGDYNFGAKVKHEGYYLGPVDGKNSAENITEIGLDGTLFQDFFQLYGAVDYDRHKFNFYGYDPENPIFDNFIPSQNILNTFKVKGGIQNIEKMEGFNYNAFLTLRRFNDNYLAVESEVGIHGKSDYWFDDYLKTSIDLNLSLTNPRDEFYSDINRNFFRASPQVAYLKDGISIRAGVNMVFENDVTLNKRADFHVFPVIKGHYMLQDEFGIYAGFEGDVMRKTYYDFVLENPFLGPSEQLLNTIQNYQVSAGVKGTINAELTYEAGVNVGKYSNMHFFGNSTADSLRFNLLYDTDTRIINYQAKIGWEYDGWYRLLGSANYYQYNTGTLGAAFQRPEWELSMNNNFTISDKWLIQANANLMGGIQGYNLQSDEVTVLPAIIDLQAKVDYQITDRISAFAIGNNLLNRTNQRFLNYPVRGIQGIIGATVKF